MLTGVTFNPDPKPGRWVLPLVVVGMVAFTYFFVQALGEPLPLPTTAPGATTSPTTSIPFATSTSVSSEDQAYLNALNLVRTDLLALQTEMAQTNEDFDSNDIKFDEAEANLDGLVKKTTEVLENLKAITVPAAYTDLQETLTKSVEEAEKAAKAALKGLRSTDKGSGRKDAAKAFDEAVNDFDTALNQVSGPTLTTTSTSTSAAAP